MLKRVLLIAAMLLILSTGTAAAQDAYPPSGNVGGVDVSNDGVGAGGGGGETLPLTGSSGTVSMAQVAVAAIAVGGLLVLVADRRRSVR